MLELLGSGVIGSLLGGLFRLAPELIKLFDRYNERSHEREMFKMQTDLERVKGDYRVEEKYVDFSVEQMKAIAQANEAEGKILDKASQWAVNLNTSVRPVISLAIFALYLTVKLTFIATGLWQGIPWSTVIYSSWTADDVGILMMILTFHFVGRPIEKYQKR